MNKDKTIDYIELPAADFDRTKAFFSTVFGWTFEDFGPDYCAFTDGRLDGGFFKSDQVVSTDAGSALVVFYAQHLEELMGTIEAAGGTISKPIFSFPGGRRFHFNDPNGNEFAVWSDA